MADVDYAQKLGTVVIPAGHKTAEINLQINGDTAVEMDEAFWVSFSNPQGLNIPIPFFTVRIKNDDEGIISNKDGYNTPKSYPGYRLVWSDEFDGSELNSSNWEYEVGRGNWGWGNNELQYYQSGSKNLEVSNGTLKITARRETMQGADFTSARIKTQGKQSFVYGRIDIRAKMPKGQGYWPALWMLGDKISTAGWPACGEIDIMEFNGNITQRVFGTPHWSDIGGGNSYKTKEFNLASGSFTDQFHVFSIIWVKDQIKWMVDDQIYLTFSASEVGKASYPFNDPFFFIFNVAVGGNFVGNPDGNSIFPQSMEVDFVRVFNE
jgi:beta-glucanase (GH16 family)